MTANKQRDLPAWVVALGMLAWMALSMILICALAGCVEKRPPAETHSIATVQANVREAAATNAVALRIARAMTIANFAPSQAQLITAIESTDRNLLSASAGMVAVRKQDEKQKTEISRLQDDNRKLREGGKLYSALEWTAYGMIVAGIGCFVAAFWLGKTWVKVGALLVAGGATCTAIANLLRPAIIVIGIILAATAVTAVAYVAWRIYVNRKPINKATDAAIKKVAA